MDVNSRMVILKALAHPHFDNDSAGATPANSQSRKSSCELRMKAAKRCKVIPKKIQVNHH
jgi:hypothetical protein